MIDTSQWRARIGHWNHRCSSCSHVSNNSTSTDSTIAAANGSILVLVRSLAIILVIVLILSGDIELNPGPGQPPQLEDVFHFLKPHSHMWEDIGRELKVVKKSRAELQQQGSTRTNNSKLEDVLYHWIQSQCSEVSWDHLMKVLREELSMAATADEIKEYLLNDSEAKMKYGWPDTNDGANSLDETEKNPDHVTPKEIDDYVKKIDRCLQQREYRRTQGIIIVVGMLGAAGTTIDVDNIEKTFKELNFAVLPIQDPTAENLVNLVKAAAKADYPQMRRFRFFGFYFTGHGGANGNGDFFIQSVTTETDKESRPIVHIERFIIEPLKNLQVPYRLFFFDCCQSPGVGQAYHHGSNPGNRNEVQERSGQVVAYAVSKGEKAVGDKDKGGVWTRYLCENIKEMIPLVNVLAKTNDEVQQSASQTPSFSCNIGNEVIVATTLKKALLDGETGVMYINGHCGWRSCDYKELCKWRDAPKGKPPFKKRKIIEEPNGTGVQSDSSCQQNPSGSPILRDLRCIRDDIKNSRIECWHYAGIPACSIMDKSATSLGEILSSLHVSKDAKQCRELASSFIAKDICTGRIEGFKHGEMDHWKSLLYFLPSIQMNAIHLYRPDILLEAIGEPVTTCVHCGKVRISCNSVSMIAQSEGETILKCIGLFSVELQEFECDFRLVFSSKFCHVLIKLLKLPSMKRVILKGEVIYHKNDADQWAKDNEQLENAIGSVESLEELMLSISYGDRPECHSKTTNAILNGVAKNISLTSLVMENFKYSEAGPALEQLLKNNRKLEKLWLLGTPCQSPPNITEINTPLKDLDILLPTDCLHSILSKTKNLESLRIYGNVYKCDLSPAPNREQGYLPLAPSKSAEVSYDSLLNCCPNLTRLCTSITVLEGLKQAPEELVVDEISYILSTRCKSLKHLEVTGSVWPGARTSKQSKVKNSYSDIISHHSTIEVLKIPVSCLEVGKLVEVNMKEKLKNLKTLELRIFHGLLSTGYDATAGIFSVVNTVLQSFDTLQELLIKNECLQTNVCMEAHIKGDHVLEKFTSAVISHRSIEYIGINLNQSYDHYTWISDVYGTILSKWPIERRHHIPVIEIHPFRGNYYINFTVPFI